MPKILITLLSVLIVALWVGPAKPAMTDKEKAELATAVSGAKVTLEQGLLVSKKNGKPVSAKFEIENGKVKSFRGYEDTANVRDAWNS